MTVYKIDKENQVNRFLNRVTPWFFRIPIYIFSFGIICFILFGLVQLLTPQLKINNFPSICGLLISVFILTLVIGSKLGKYLNFHLLGAWNNFSSKLKNFEIEIGEDYIILRHFDTSTFRLSSDEVTEIKETFTGILVYPSSIYRSLEFSKRVKGYQDARVKLEKWLPIQKATFKDYIKYYWIGIPYFIFSIAGLIALFSNMNYSYSLFPNSTWAIISGSLLFGISMIFFILLFQKHETIHDKVKRFFIILIIMEFIFVVGSRIYIDHLPL